MNKTLPSVFDSEWELLKIIWDNPDGISMRELIQWGKGIRDRKRTTVYTLVNRMEKKGLLTWERQEKNLVSANYTLKEVRRDKLRILVTQCYEGLLDACIEDLKNINENHEQLPVVFDKEWLLLKIICTRTNGMLMREIYEDAAVRQGWARTTVYAMVKRMSDRGILIWNRGKANPIYAIYTMEELRRDKLHRFISQFYDGNKKICMEDLKWISG